jgi:hypothetical protein
MNRMDAMLNPNINNQDLFQERFMKTKLLLLMASAVLTLLVTGSAVAQPNEESAGRQQLIDAFDAAWVRVVRSGEYRSIINNFQEPIPGIIDATEYVINQSDCLPNPDVTPFPSANNLKGRFAEIIANEEIRRGEVTGAPWFISGGANTADWFSNGFGGSDILADLLAAILAEIANHYGTGPINVVSVEIPFPFNTTSALQDGIFGVSLNPFSQNYTFRDPVNLPGVTVDFLDQFNAKGGESEELRRLKGRRATCTLSSSSQFVHVPEGSEFEITSIDDLRADPSIRICTGNLSTQTANQYFPDNTVITERQADIKDCYIAIRDDQADVFINSLPVNPPPNLVGAIGAPAFEYSVDLKIVAGTPYWVQEDNVECEPLFVPGPFPPGTFRECKKDD